MNVEFYSKLLQELKTSVVYFLKDGTNLSNEVEEDISSIIETVDITSWTNNIDGVVKNSFQLLTELKESNEEHDRQKCIESIAMLRVAIADIENAFSNTKDSMENLIVSIRDNE